MAFAFGEDNGRDKCGWEGIGGAFSKARQVLGVWKKRRAKCGGRHIQSSIRFRATQFAARLSCRLAWLFLDWQPLNSAIIQLIPGNIIHEWPLRSTLPIMMTTSWRKRRMQKMRRRRRIQMRRRRQRRRRSPVILLASFFTFQLPALGFQGKWALHDYDLVQVTCHWRHRRVEEAKEPRNECTHVRRYIFSPE